MSYSKPVPPGTPPPSPPPPGPSGPTPTGPPSPPHDAVFSAAVADIRSAVARIESPARQGSNRMGSGLGGPVLPPDDSAGGVRAGSPPAPGAGDSFAVGSADCGHGFTLPEPAPPPRFEPGGHRLYGRVRMFSMGDGGLSGALEARWRS